jgi:hypothetical protein
MSTQTGLQLVWFILSACVIVGAIFAISVSFSLTRTGIVITTLALALFAIGLTYAGELLIDKI